jgi:hypothetical protein
MAQRSKYIHWHTLEEEPIQLEEYTVAPVSQALIIQIPHFHFSWNRPVAVRVDDGTTSSRIRIVDWTRVIQLGFALLGLAVVSIYWVRGSK